MRGRRAPDKRCLDSAVALPLNAGRMAIEPAMSGEIPPDGVLEILREIEEQRITGRLRFTARSADGSTQTGEVELVAGQLALDQDALPDGTDPVERLLALRSGHFVVHPRLPALPISQGDDLSRSGSLAVHVPADLMNYCEQSGLTGTLVLARERERVELVYEHGQLLAIRVDGRDDGDLSHAFGWNDGTFRIAVNAKARTLVPQLVEEDEDPTAREPTTQFVRPRTARDDTGRQFLKVLEVALTDIVAKREQARPRAAPLGAGASPPSVRPRPLSLAAPSAGARKREPTVRVVYLKPDDPTTAFVPPDSRTRHAAAGARREDALPDAAPARRRDPATGEELTSGGSRVRTPSTKIQIDRALLDVPPPAPAPRGPGLAPIAWIVAVVLIGLLALGLLAQLPHLR